MDRNKITDGVTAGDEEERGPSLCAWERNVAIASIEECVEKIIRILKSNNLLDNTVCNLSFVPTDVKYLDLIKSRILYTSEERALKDMETKAVFQKLKNDSAFVVNILENVAHEMRSRGSFSALEVIPIEVARSRAKESLALSKARENLEGLKRLRELISQERQTNEREAKDCEKKLSIATRELETRRLEGKLSIAYVSAWEKARCEQNIRRCKNAEQELQRTLERLAKEEENENRVTADIGTFLCHNIAENEERIAKWKNRYDREWIQFSGEIDTLQKRIKLEKQSLERLREEQRVKQEFIDFYLAEKEADRRMKERKEHARRSTIKIQAWWRGVMVRQKLGRYRPEEKKKKRPPKSKK